MTCESCEQLLSAYHDHTLDASTREGVAAHLRTCERCAAMLADFERNDLLLAELPRVAPAPELRDRIFSAPEYLTLLQHLDREASADPGAPVSIREVRPHAHAAPAWRRALLPVAAALVLLSGGFFAHGLITSATTTAGNPPMVAIGNPGASGIPLAAGERAIYAHNGRLWSGAATGKQPAQALTPTGEQVIAWAAAPRLAGSGSTLIATIDATGKVHLLRADGQSDTVIGSAGKGTSASHGFWSGAAGQVVRASLSWSPDGKRLAFVSINSNGSAALNVYDVSAQPIAAHPHVAIPFATGALPATLAWSADGQHIAYSQPGTSATTIWAYDLAHDSVAQVAAQADPNATSAQVGQLSWASDSAHPQLTWTATQHGAVVGLFAWAPGQAATTLYTSSAATVFATFSAATNTWLVGDGTHLLAVSIAGAVTDGGSLSLPVATASWNAQGTAAALTSGSTVYVWAPGSAPYALGEDVDAAVTPAWSGDGQRVAYATGGGIAIAQVKLAQGSWSVSASTVAVQGASGLLWSPDGQTLAVTAPDGVSLASTSGSARLVDPARADGGILAWTIAG